MTKPFSQRYGYVKVEDVIQVERLDEKSRTVLWSCLYSELLTREYFGYMAEKVMSRFWTDFIYRAADEEPVFVHAYAGYKGLKDYMKEFFYEAEWFRLFDFIEFSIETAAHLSECYNEIFRRMSIGYSIVNGLVSPIVDETEIESIQNAVDSGTEASRAHFECALAMLSDREQPDFRNSIKESISAIESLCKKISGNDKGTLGECLKTIEDSGHIHSSMKHAFLKLYGYTSDQGGIRHALTDDSESPTLEDARYMLVICSAFSNYLISKMGD